MHGGQVAVDAGNQVVVHRHGHAVGKQRRLQRAGVVARPSVVHIALHRAGQRRGQRMPVVGVVAIVLVERRLADASPGRVHQRAERGVAQLDPLAPVVADRAELHVGVVQLAEDLPHGLGHLGLHRQQLFLFPAERVRLVSQQSR